MYMVVCSAASPDHCASNRGHHLHHLLLVLSVSRCLFSLEVITLATS